MKTFLLFISSSLVSICTTQAQITLTQQTTVPQVGETFIYNEISASSLNVFNGGANQTWDFSSLGTGTQSNSNVINLSNASEPNNFPQSSIVVTNGTSEKYIQSTSAALMINGIYSPNDFRITYYTPMILTPFPLTYNSIYHDTLIGSYDDLANSLTFTLNGFTDIKADGYGTLILPGATINNTLRIRNITSNTSTYMGQTSTAIDTSYIWCSLNTNVNIASISTNGDVSYISSNSLTSTIFKDNNQFNFSIFPNPAQDYIKITGGKLNENTQVVIYDVLGNKVLSKKMTTKLNITDLSKGVYIIKLIENNSILFTDQIIKN